ncbi:tyrosine-type recombinase/integrase [Desulfonatronum lacustre]|uniref:tyrosine-type recombinase/integrase n=1 Tax=Desulfonatronum lacustre TaxID=66849 RepID=UPI0004B82C18|nr:integrase arm-type DNA-binding domain-containing protein [Desulfonatronum lacustre]
MSLTVKKIDTLKPKEKTYLVIDADGLYLAVYPSGKKVWRFRYQLDGKRNQIVLGQYPDLSLADARNKAGEKRNLLAEKIDPSKARCKGGAITTFKDVALAWHGANRGRWTPDHADLTLRRIEQDLFPWIGAMSIEEIRASDMLTTLRRVESRGACEVARRLRGIASNIFQYSIAEGRDHNDPAASVQKALVQRTVKSFSAITKPNEVAELLRNIAAYKGSNVVRLALLFSAYTFARPGEVRHAEWNEIDFDTGLWTIPKEKTKRRREHVVPLARQTLEVLRELQPQTGGGQWLFPSNRGKGRCMSENTVRIAIRSMGYDQDQMTAHGFRSTASTLLNESGKWDFQTIELQLAHVQRDKVAGVYNRSERMDERQAMMQWYADYLDLLTSGGKVLSFPSKDAAVNE